MKLRHLNVHNFRSIVEAEVEVHDYTMVVGANNAGKSNLFGALRAFYEDIKWSKEDFPKVGALDEDSWVQLTFELDDAEWAGLADRYKEGVAERSLTVRRYFASKSRNLKSNQSNIHAVIGGVPEEDNFYGAKNISTAKLGRIIYIPALTTPNDQMKTTGPSPLRDMLNFMFKQLVAGSTAYQTLESAFGVLNNEARGDGGFISKIVNPINDAISDWGVRFDMGVNPISPEEITKNLIRHGFVDAMLGDSVFAIERYGHGFQRSFLYELMKLAPQFSERKQLGKKEFDPDFTLILFEEPEAFLHPSQQENMAYNLRQLGEGAGQQVLITTHSPTFVGKASDDICQIVRVQRKRGVSTVSQVQREKLLNVLGKGGGLVEALRAFVEDPTVDPSQKKGATELIKSAPDDKEVAIQEERFRYQLWLDSERASMFFADRVLLVEGATEKALFTYLLAREWKDLSQFRIAIVDVYGKFNFHRFMALLDAFSLPYGMILDDDGNKTYHKAINEMLVGRAKDKCLAEPKLLAGCMEKFLGTQLPGREDQKPVEILKALEERRLPAERLASLREVFMGALGLS